MESREIAGQAFRNGEIVASEILLIEQGEVQSTAFPISGSNRYGHRQRVIRGESTIRFVELDDQTLEAELEKLIAASSDIDLKRQLRDERASTTVDLTLEDGRNLSNCVLRYPISGPAQLEVTDFPILLPDPKA
jgi:hypothetical protein